MQTISTISYCFLLEGLFTREKQKVTNVDKDVREKEV